MSLTTMVKPGNLFGKLFPCQSLAFTPDGRILVAGGNEGIVRFWDVDSGTLVGTGDGHQGCINQVHVTVDGYRTVTIGMDRLIGFFNIPRDDGES